MKNIIVLFALLFVANLSAQELSKQEKAELLEEIKLLKENPVKLKTLKESVSVRDVIIADQNKQIASLKKEIQQKDLQKNSLTDSLNYLSSKILSSEKNVYKPLNDNEPPLDHDGMKYRVQIGVFKNYDITHLFDEPKYIVHEDVYGLHRYSVGNFNSMEDAEAFKVEMRRLGIKDAFVSTYKDGTRIDDVPNYSVTPEKTTYQPSVQKIEVAAPKTAPSGFNNAKPVIVYPSKQIESNPMDYPVKVIENNPKPLDYPITTTPPSTEVKINADPVTPVQNTPAKTEVKINPQPVNTPYTPTPTKMEVKINPQTVNTPTSPTKTDLKISAQPISTSSSAPKTEIKTSPDPIIKKDVVPEVKTTTQDQPTEPFLFKPEENKSSGIKINLNK